MIQWFHAERRARPNVPAYSLGSPAERFILATSRVPRHQEYLAAAKLRASRSRSATTRSTKGLAWPSTRPSH